MKNFLKFCVSMITDIFVLFTFSMIAVEIFFVICGIYSMWALLLISIALTVIMTIYVYSKNKDYFEQLYTMVCMTYKIGDEYKIYTKIKKIILTYKFNDKVDVKQNISVIQAALERDNAHSIFYSALLTIFGVILGVVNGEDSLLNMEMIVVYLMLIVMYINAGRTIPRNSFIKKVIDTIEVN